jgi:hypothetical protein
MTRKEEVERAWLGYAVQSYYRFDERSFKEGVEWADKTMIDKVCKILENVTVTYNKRFFGKCEENAFDADFIKEIRKAMEE